MGKDECVKIIKNRWLTEKKRVRTIVRQNVEWSTEFLILELMWKKRYQRFGC